MKISDLKQPYRRMAEYLAEKNTNPIKNVEDFSWYETGVDFWKNVYHLDYPPITEEIKKHFPPDFDFSEEEEAVNTNPFSVDDLSLNQIAVRMFKKNFMDLELWEQGLVNETVEQNDIAKNSIIELPNNPIIQKRIYTQLAKEGKFNQLPDTCEFSEAVELEVTGESGDLSKNFRRITGKFKGNYMDIHCIGWKNVKLPTPEIDFSQFNPGDILEITNKDNEKYYGLLHFQNINELFITFGYKSDKVKCILKDDILSISKLK